ncbi:MAG: protein kinase [Candidatus Lindowbacteria bacterium]|nr:protein kinase [Candidatus Lindowbacteria bacterium]
MSFLETAIINEDVGNFHVVEFIGRGAMASVYRAFDKDLERDVALKIMDPRYVEDANLTGRFQHEARALSKLRHRNIVHIYSVGKHQGVPYLAMEYVHGGPLSRILAERTRLEVDEAVEYILQVCEAVECAHRNDIIHRDLKPSNILVESSGRVLVADFGISKIISPDTTEDTLTFVGTPIYMSPEQCGEGALDHRTDIYSLGVIFYEMVLGRTPFDGKTPAEIIKGHLLDSPKFPSGDVLPPRIVKILRKMLAKSPTDRYATVRDLAYELELWKKEAREIPRAGDEELIDTQTAPLVICYIPQRILLGAVNSALRNIRHRLLTTPTPAEMLKKYTELAPKLAILSHEPGKMVTFRLADKLKHVKKSPPVQLILLSHGISREEVETAFRNGITDIIAEPLDPSILVSKLENALLGQQRSIESRRFFRKAISGKITVRMESEILDISEGGMRIATDTPLRTGEVVKLESKLFHDLRLGEKAGRVVWISKNDAERGLAFQAGIDFVDLTVAERSILRKWIFAAEVSERAKNAIGSDMGPACQSIRA